MMFQFFGAMKAYPSNAVHAVHLELRYRSSCHSASHGLGIAAQPRSLETLENFQLRTVEAGVFALSREAATDAVAAPWQLVSLCYTHTYIHTYIHPSMHACIHPSIHPDRQTDRHTCMHAYIHRYMDT